MSVGQDSGIVSNVFDHDRDGLRPIELLRLAELSRFALSFGDFGGFWSCKRLILLVVDWAKRPKAAVVPTKGIFSGRDL